MLSLPTSLLTVPPATQTQHSMPDYLQVCRATNATIPLPGDLPPSTCHILTAVVKIVVSTMRGQPAAIAIRLTFLLVPASNATTAITPEMGEAAIKSCHHRFKKNQAIYLLVMLIFPY